MPKRQSPISSRLEVKGIQQLDIGEVVWRSGTPASTLRCYEEKGLIASNSWHGLCRPFGAGMLKRLAPIGLGRAAGLSLDEIADMDAADGVLRIDRAAPAAEVDELDWTIRRLAAMRDGLRHAAAYPVRKHMDCPTLRHLLRAAAAGAIKLCQRAPGVQQNGRQIGHPCPVCQPRGTPLRRAGTTTV